MGSWLLYCNSNSKYSWIDYVGLFHNNQTSDNFGFLDGHVETRQWEDPRVIDAGLMNQFDVRTPKSADWDWIRPRFRQLPDDGNVKYIHAKQ